MELRVATGSTLPEPDADEEVVIDALRAVGIDAALCAWDGEQIDWDLPIPTVLRSTWNYVQAPDRFLAWAERAARAAPFWNDLDVVRWNIHKRYLLDLKRRGIPVPPTVVVQRNESLDLPALGWDHIVIKPAVSAGSFQTRHFNSADEEAQLHLSAVLDHSDALIQPFLKMVDAQGETAIIWLDGEVTHAVRKLPRFSGQPESVEGPIPIAADEATLVTDALRPFADRLLYARVDVVRSDSGLPMIMELELIEPSLFFRQAPWALERFAKSLKHRLRIAYGA